MKFFYVFITLSLYSPGAAAQSCFPDDADTTINLNCSSNCTDLNFTIPDLRQSSEYKVLDIPYNPLPFTDSRGEAVTFTGAWPGNSYSRLYDLPFGFCFFNQVYNSLVIGANGTVTFDGTMANGWCDPLLKRAAATFPLPNTRYPPALIAAVMHDLDPGDTARVSSGRKIEFRIEGDAPCRKAVISFYRVPLWPGPQRNCQASINTHQLILYESTGIIDVFVKDSPQCAGSNEGYNTLGIQNFARDLAYFPRNKNCTQWGGSDLNLGYRFLPSGGNSLLVNAHLYLNGRDLGVGTVTPGAEGSLNVSFPFICPRAGNNIYELRASYASCSGAGTIELRDTIYVNKNNSLSATATAQPALCTSPTGSIRVDVPTGQGMPPFQFSINGNPPQASNTFVNLAAGTYTVIVTDASICSDTLTVEVNSLSTLNVSVSVTNTSCNGASDGMIRVAPGGGVAPILYSCNGSPPQASPVFSNLPSGNYRIDVTDAAGCTSTNNFAVVLPGPPLSTTATKTDVSCNGANNGVITINPPSAGVAPYTYSLDGVTYQSSNVFTGLAAGTYTIRFRDAGGCSGQLDQFIVEPALLQGSASVAPALCNNQGNGKITVQPTGGTAPYTYSIDGTNYQAFNEFNVAAGVYTVYIRDQNGCAVSVPGISVTVPPALTAGASTTNATCDGGDDGVITVAASGGSGGYSYSLDGLNFQTSNNFAVAPGLYSITVKDVNGCRINIPPVLVGLTNTLTLTPTADETICEGDQVQLQVISNATQYSWSSPATLNNPAVSNPVASPAASTEYVVTAALGRCSTTDTIMVNVHAAPVPDAGIDGDICVGQTYQLQGSGGVGYSWEPAIFLSNTTIANPVAAPDKTTSYTLHVTDNNGCRSLQPDRVTVQVTPPIRVITSPADTIVYEGDQFKITALSAGTDYTWSPQAGLSNPNIADPVVTAGTEGSITVYKVIASTSAGCTGEGFVTVNVYKGPGFYVPTGFTPNNDGKNDRFRPVAVGMKQVNYFRVFNRWGQQVYSSTVLNQGWDGKLAGREQDSGVYTWIIQGVTATNKVITKRGTVVLIR